MAVAALLLSGLLWGTTWMPLKYFATQGLTGITVTLCAYGLVGAAALPWMFRQRAAWLPQWRLVAGVGMFCGLANACFTTAMMFGEVARAMLLFYLVPVWGVLGGWLFLGEKITAPRSLAAAMAIAGALLVLGGPEVLSSAPRLLDFAAIGAGFFYAAQNLCARASDRTPVLPKMLMAFVGCTGVAALLLPFTGAGRPVLSVALGLALLAFALIWLVAAMWTQTYGASHLESGRASVLVLFELLAAVVTALWIGGERLDALGWTGAALIVIAALIEARGSSAPPAMEHA